MTAEVAILNRDGVALAADSAVTVSGYGQDGVREKSYNSANKVFMLSDSKPVGIMVYANSTLEGIGWETLIKMYRAKRQGTSAASFETLEDYAEDFIKFVSKEAPDHEGWPTLADKAEKALDSLIQFVSQEIDPENFNDECEKCLKKILEDMQEDPLFNSDVGVMKFEEPIRSKLMKKIDDLSDILPKGVKLSNKMVEFMIEVCEQDLSRKDEDSASGVVIAGYGESELFPSLWHYRVWGCYKDQLVVELEGDPYQVSLVHSACICPCAQTDMMETFFSGISGEIFYKLLEEIPLFLNRLIDDLIEGRKYPVIPKSLTVSKEERGKITDKYEKEIVNKLIDFARPQKQQILDTIDLMPKNELASMAEAFVNLASLKLRARGENESVGGPVDVALISKGDGFTWIKRKSQIPLELNPHLLSKAQMWESVGSNPLG